MSHTVSAFLEKKLHLEKFQEIFIVLGMSILIALFARISIPMPFTPVPLATQNSLILFLAIALGPTRAFWATILFLVQGASGFPVFAGGISYGIAHFFGPTGGYLLAYPVAVLLTVHMSRKLTQTVVGQVTAVFLGHLMIIGLGTLVLSLTIGLKRALLLGAAPFLIGDFIKTLLIVKWKLKA